MDILKRIQKRMFNYEKWLAGLLLTMPLILMLFDGGKVRSSISDYAYMQDNQVFFFLIFLSAFAFFNNGTIWVKKYNLTLGVLLAIVGLTPYLEFPITHTLAAGLFFAYSCFVMIKYSSKKQRTFKILASIFILIGIAGHYIFHWYSLLYAEWIMNLPICIHFYGESKGKID